MRNSGRARPCLVWLLFGSALLACSADSDPLIDAPLALGPGSASGPIFGPDAPSEAAPGYFDGQACAEQTLEPDVAAATLLLVVDTSGSMNDDAPGALGSKWIVTRRAVLAAIAGMPGDTSLGVVFYPDQPQFAGSGLGSLGNLFSAPGPSATCFDRRMSVDIGALGAAGSAQRQRIQRAFEQQLPEGGTPTHDAYRFALSELQATPATGPRFIVLITDGVPTFALGCAGTGRQQDPVDPTPLIVEAAEALAKDLGTFVIGSPGSEGARDSLSLLAVAGGTSPAQCSPAGPSYCHLDLTREADLGAGLEGALRVVSNQASACSYALPRPAAGAALDPDKVNVLYGTPGQAPQLIARSVDDSCSEGWRYSDDQSQIRLCPRTCERSQAGAGRITLQVGCLTVVR